MKKDIQHTYRFQSNSDPGKFYETLLYVDGTTSCNCPGWTRHVQSDGSRKCRHVKEVASGMKPATKPNFFDTQVQLLTAQKVKGKKLIVKPVVNSGKAVAGMKKMAAAVIAANASLQKMSKPLAPKPQAAKKPGETFVLEKPRRVFNLDED